MSQADLERMAFGAAAAEEALGRGNAGAAAGFLAGNSQVPLRRKIQNLEQKLKVQKRYESNLQQQRNSPYWNPAKNQNLGSVRRRIRNLTNSIQQTQAELAGVQQSTMSNLNYMPEIPIRAFSNFEPTQFVPEPQYNNASTITAPERRNSMDVESVLSTYNQMPVPAAALAENGLRPFSVTPAPAPAPPLPWYKRLFSRKRRNNVPVTKKRGFFGRIKNIFTRRKVAGGRRK